ncbi:RDD family protein [Helicobacter sp. MIT 14-3879]|uniref:RDD family protein n=1 Tax=Helicobacter sp. MIT 14-3879 TaxID=2040649 RepID=UPI000E1E7D85|nr:RDD family protein [Helicobacter sp. MIT 14-3879]RDU61401.1 hypothetical protein CQA44_09055 [Helicobacter sp. MIT 14-3879]
MKKLKNHSATCRIKPRKTLTNKFLDGRTVKRLDSLTNTESNNKGFLIARLKAFITDMFLINMPLLYIVTYVILDGKEDFLNNQIAIALCGGIYCLILFLFLWIAGQTPGFRYAEIMLVSLDSHQKQKLSQEKKSHVNTNSTESHSPSKPKAWQAFVFIVVWLIELSMFLWIIYFLRKDKRSLHEIASDTKIIYKANRPKISINNKRLSQP